ncbi:ribosome biogenesis GTPase YlqF [Aquabacterium lacunae]|uniref:Ribosome biogenesis GTPase A n=1 Tax=Aquabacterium lacunae TaxID=2528630 RepID=A0A4Q9H328_9BURK|nr:ribosome biogenesis GTPase YlqF [Aquabacterium lacunae]TBO30074.1 ribosome biogenesis GTPase YlqF [Aquabacterium lacunae]
MAIQWFPGHMHVTQKAIKERIKDIDVVIELLDARLPGASRNPLLDQITGHRLRLKVLNKQDLADPERTEAWLAHYNGLKDTRAIALDASDKAPAQRLIKACRELAPHRSGMDKPLRVLICGIPNVGKSTLMNTLVGRKAAKTGDEAGVTRMEQRINLASDFYLFDTPGMLWPKLTVEKGGYHLAASGAVGRNAYDEEEVALELLQSLKGPYPHLLQARYKLDPSLDIAQAHEDTLLEAIGRKRGAVIGGNRVNTTKAAEVVLNDFRQNLLGRVTLETPEQFAQWQAEADAREAALQKVREEKAKGRKRSFRGERESWEQPGQGPESADSEDGTDSEQA